MLISTLWEYTAHFGGILCKTRIIVVYVGIKCVMYPFTSSKASNAKTKYCT